MDIKLKEEQIRELELKVQVRSSTFSTGPDGRIQQAQHI